MRKQWIALLALLLAALVPALALAEQPPEEALAGAEAVVEAGDAAPAQDFAYDIPPAEANVQMALEDFLVDYDDMTVITYLGAGGNVVVPVGITGIRALAFNYCDNVTAVVLPDTCTSIGDNAFEHCEALTDISIPASVVTIGANVFEGVPKTLKIHGDAGSVAQSWAEANGFTFVADGGGSIIIPVEPNSVKITKGKTAKLKKGKKLKLTAVTDPEGAQTTLTWKSSNKKVATVTQDGVVKGKKKGTAKITVTTSNGKKATIKVTVK